MKPAGFGSAARKVVLPADALPAAPSLLGLVPCGEWLKIRHPGETGLGIRRDCLRRDHNIEQRRAIGERTFDRGRQIRLALDALSVEAESLRHRRIVGELQARS